MVHVDWRTLGRIVGVLADCRIAGQLLCADEGWQTDRADSRPDFVLTYEMFILGGVYITVLGFLICAGLPASRSPLYSAKVSEDQIGMLVKA